MPALYRPPECAFDRVVLRLDVVSEGRQFDRLAVMYLGDIEVWRTSTAEPKPKPGIVWTIRKDFTPYLALWRKPQTLIFDLGNLVNEKYTGAFNATLTAIFFESDVLGPNGVSADMILPISAQRGGEGKGSAFIYPETPAETVLTLPRNINRGILTISATGQADEEFWWSNVPEKAKDLFELESGPLPGLSSYREVQLRIDDQLAGFAVPFPVVFTGGISPPLHRPVVGLQAFDLRENEIDISPFLGIVCDGQQHKFSIDVYGVDDSNGTVRQVPVSMHWVLTGKVFLWLDEEETQTVGNAPQVIVSNLDYVAESTMIGGTVLIQQTVQRSLRAFATIKTHQSEQVRAWDQQVTMGSKSSLATQGDDQYVEALYEHVDSSTVDDRLAFSTRGVFPINSDSKYRAPDGKYDFSLKAALLSATTLSLGGQHVFPTGLEPFVKDAEEEWNQSNIHTSKLGAAFFFSMNGGNSTGGTGSTEQKYELTATRPLYMRFVKVSNETTVHDREFTLNRRYSDEYEHEATDSEPARQRDLDTSSPWLSPMEQQLNIWSGRWNPERWSQQSQKQ